MSQLKIAVAARKGGVGKTTLTVALASIFAHRGKRVLVIDCDPQSNAAFALGANATAPGTAELLLGEKPEPLGTDAEGLQVLPGGPRLEDRQVSRLDSLDLSHAIKMFPHDVILFDCPPGNDHLERFAVRAANAGLAVVDGHPLAVLGARRVMDDIETDRAKGYATPERMALVMCRLDQRRAMDRDLSQTLERSFPGLPRFGVRQDSKLALATATGTPLMKLPASQRGPATEDIGTVADWIGKGEA